MSYCCNGYCRPEKHILPDDYHSVIYEVAVEIDICSFTENDMLSIAKIERRLYPHRNSLPPGVKIEAVGYCHGNQGGIHSGWGGQKGPLGAPRNPGTSRVEGKKGTRHASPDGKQPHAHSWQVTSDCMKGLGIMTQKE